MRVTTRASSPAPGPVDAEKQAGDSRKAPRMQRSIAEGRDGWVFGKSNGHISAHVMGSSNDGLHNVANRI